MARVVIANAFSVNMLSKPSILVFKQITLEDAKTIIEKALRSKIPVYSIVGHQSTADYLSKALGIEVQYNRVQYTMEDGDLLLVFTVPRRLGEGAVLPRLEEVRVTRVYKATGYQVYPVDRGILYLVMGT